MYGAVIIECSNSEHVVCSVSSSSSIRQLAAGLYTTLFCSHVLICHSPACLSVITSVIEITFLKVMHYSYSYLSHTV